MIPRTRIVLVRHGESHWNVEGRWQGHAGAGLSERGRAQSTLTAAFLARSEGDVVEIVRSDLDRAAETAEPLMDQFDVPVSETAGWREIDVGRWAGHTHQEIAARDPGGYAAWQRGEDVPSRGGETALALRNRVRSALRAITHRHPSGTVLVVTHGGPIRAAACEAFAPRPTHEPCLAGVDNCSVSVVEMRGGAWCLASYNSTGHLATVD